MAVPDIDTSMNRDPSPTHDELLRIRDRMMAKLGSGAPVREIHSANLRTPIWRQDIEYLRRGWRTLGVESKEANRCEALAQTGEHLGLDRVGLIIETFEVTP